MDLELFLRAQKGDDDARTEIIESFEGWIMKQCRYYHLKGYDQEDLKQVCYQALLAAIPHIKPKELNGAVSYVIRCMDNALKKEARKVLSKPPLDSLNSLSDSGSEIIDCLPDEGLSTENLAILRMDKISLKQGLDSLSRQERDLISWYVCNPYGGLKEYAEKYHADYRRVRYQKDLALKKIKSFF